MREDEICLSEMVLKTERMNNGCLGAKFRKGMCQTTIPRQAYCNRSRAQIEDGVISQIRGAGEIPLIRNGVPLTGNAEGEEIVLYPLETMG